MMDFDRHYPGDDDPWSGYETDSAATVAPNELVIEPLMSLDLAALANVQPVFKAFAIERVAPLGEVTLFTGPGGAGKSLLAQQFATCAAAGLTCLGLAVALGPALYLTCEDGPDQLHFRQYHICRSLNIRMADLAGKLHIVSLRGALDNELAIFSADGKLNVTATYERLALTVAQTGAKLVFLDNVAHLFTGNENDRGDVTRFANLLSRLAGETGAAIILVGHPNKAGASYSGSTAWLNAVRSHAEINRPDDSDSDPDARVLRIGKANYAQSGNEIAFRWLDWCFVRDEDLPDDQRAELSLIIKTNGENAAFLACLRERTAQGDGRAVGPSPGPNYAPTQFEGMALAKGLQKAALKRAMDRLFTIGAIESIEVPNKKSGRSAHIIREVSGEVHNPSHNPCTTQVHNPAQQAAQPRTAHTPP